MNEVLTIFLAWVLGVPLFLYGSMLLHDFYEKNKQRIFFDIPSLNKS